MSGKTPFGDERYSSLQDKLAGHVRDDLPRLSLPKRIDAVLKKMVAKSPANRFTSASDVAAALIPPRHVVRNTLLALLFVAIIVLTTFFIARQDDGAEAFFNSGARHLEQQAYPDAIRDFTEAIRRRPTFLEAYNKRAECFESVSDDDSAIADLTEVIRRQPERAYAYYNRGSCFARQGKLDDAIRDFNESIRLDPRSYLTFNNRAEVYRRQGSPL